MSSRMPAARNMAPPCTGNLNMPQQRILIVDDDTHTLEVLQLWFAKANFDVVVASNGDEAFRILSNAESLDLVLTDFMMPELNGIELVRRVKTNDRLVDTPIVVMSNNGDPACRRRAIELGASAYLLKTDGAQAVAEKAIHLINGRARRTSAGQTPPAPTAQIQAMQQSLLALVRLAAQTDGLPPQARQALNSAEKLAESLFAIAPESES